LKSDLLRLWTAVTHAVPDAIHIVEKALSKARKAVNQKELSLIGTEAQLMKKEP